MEILWYIVLGYLLIINIFTFIVWGIDKWKSQNQKWRIKESTLLKFTALGGFLGALIGMNMFHHKTIKGTFLRRFMLIMFLRVIVFAAFTYLWWVQ